MSTDEFRGTRALLVAAVALLAMCTVTMVLVVSSINDLATEISKDRDEQLKPTNEFNEDFAVAESYLESAKEFEVARGIRFFADLKSRYVTRRDEIAWRLALHYRKNEAHQKAVDEFRYMADFVSGLMKNPRYYVFYADSLMKIDRTEEAEQVLFVLAANESHYTAPEMADGTPRDPALVLEHRHAVKESYLLMGRIFKLQARAIDGPQANAGPVDGTGRVVR